jgi:DNA-binding MarR family transcriptional regulator
MVGSMVRSAKTVPASADDTAGTPAEAFAGRAYRAVEDDVPGIDLVVFRAMFGLSRAASRLVADFESVVQRPQGLSWSGFRLLFCLQVSGPLQTGELARLLFLTAPTVSSVVNTLESRGWVRRARGSEDRRRVSVHLTPAGDRLVRAAAQAQHRRERDWTADVSADDLAAFVRVAEHLATRPRPEAVPA